MQLCLFFCGVQLGMVCALGIICALAGETTFVQMRAYLKQRRRVYEATGNSNDRQL